MRGTRYAMAMAIGLCVLAVKIEPAAAQARGGDKGRAAKRAVHEERDSTTSATFSSTVDEQGNARLGVVVDGFTLEKIVAPTGDATIRLTQGADVVAIAVNHTGYSVARGRRTARFDPQTGTQDDLDAIRGVLLGSPAVRTFRRLTAAIENRDDDAQESPLVLGALIDGAVVQMLDGDGGAPRRISKRVTRRYRAAFHPARLRPAELFNDCILNFEMSLVEASDLYTACTQTSFNTPWYLRWGSQSLCDLEYLIRTQQYISQFLGCFNFPL
jgi:hypothetical protein